MQSSSSPLLIDSTVELVCRYHVASVDKAPSPPDGAEGDWYCYVLTGGCTPITGLRRGTLMEVTEHARRCARDLNDRSNGKRLSTWAPRRAKVP